MQRAARTGQRVDYQRRVHAARAVVVGLDVQLLDVLRAAGDLDVQQGLMQRLSAVCLCVEAALLHDELLCDLS
eukprot:6515380-Prymnesium_polylepis.1